MGYHESFPLERWHGARREAIDTLAAAHVAMGEVEGPGRPLEIGRPIAHAYVLRVVAEFQAFSRDLHDLAAEKTVELSGAMPEHRPLLTTATTEGRYIDRGNADLRSLASDFKRIGISGVSRKTGALNGHWEPAPVDAATVATTATSLSCATAWLTATRASSTDCGKEASPTP